MNNKNLLLNTIKYTLIGMALGSIATMAVASNCKLTNKIKCTADNAVENISSLLKFPLNKRKSTKESPLKE